MKELSEERSKPGAPCGGFHRQRPGRQGFSLLELLVALAIIAILIGFVAYLAVALRKSAGTSGCLSNLAAIHKALTAYCQANGGRFPDLSDGERSFESVVKPFLGGDSVFLCPADGEVYPSLGSSYDWRDTGDLATTLAGRPMIGARPDAVLAFDALPNWHAKGTMNAVLVNGSTMSMDEQDCIGDLRKPASH